MAEKEKDKSTHAGLETTNRRPRTARKKPSKSPSTGATPTKVGGTGSRTAKQIEDENKVKWAKKTLTLSCKTLSEEFNQKIKRYADVTKTTAYSVKNDDKNRYADVLCLDETRVHLKGRKPEEDYIHANWVKNPDGTRLICTQGPLDETIADFWLMVVTEKVCMILQLCNFFEGEDNEKCAKYFPVWNSKDPKENTKSYGNDKFKVTNLGEMSDPSIEGCTCSNLEITYEKKKYRVRHLLMASWPDQCAPVSSDKVLELWKWVKKETRAPKEDEPVIVHCSAGVGRTATYAAIELAAHRIGKKAADCSMMEVVKEMRSMRFQAVQSYVQYLFLHLIMLDLFHSEKLIDKPDPESKFIKDYRRFASKKIDKMKAKEAGNKKGGKEDKGGKKTSMLEDDQPPA